MDKPGKYVRNLEWGNWGKKLTKEWKEIKDEKEMMKSVGKRRTVIKNILYIWEKIGWERCGMEKM